MSESQSATIKELYEVLAAGSTLRMEFATPEQAETFRIKFFKYKASQEQSLIDIGFLDKDQVMSSSCIAVEPGVYELKFKEKRTVRTYSFVIVKDPANVASR